MIQAVDRVQPVATTVPAALFCANSGRSSYVRSASGLTQPRCLEDMVMRTALTLVLRWLTGAAARSTTEHT